MSGKVVGWAFDQRLGSQAAKLVLVKLADNANDEGLCWPGVPKMAGDTELSERTVRREIGWLEEQGYLTVRRRVGQRGQVSNVYQLNVPWTRSSKGAPPPATESGGDNLPLTVEQAPPATQSGDTLNVCQGHKENRQTEPSLNLPPADARAPEGRVAGLGREAGAAANQSPRNDRMALLAKVIGPDRQKNHWFDGAYFREGSPVTIVLATRARCSRARDLFGFQLRDVFGDDLIFDFERPPVAEDA